MYNLCLVFVLLFVLVQTGLLLLCYECVTLFDSADECGEEFEPENVDTKECDGSDVCMIHVIPEILQFPEVIQRGCVDRFFCSKSDEWTAHCVTCEDDLCNGSSTIAPSITIAAVYFVVNNYT